MFPCSGCKLLKDEVVYLREQVKQLQDRLMALADAKAYGAVSFSRPAGGDYYGNGEDKTIEINEYGEQVLVKPKKVEQ